jgi:hypothetical protein
VDRSLGQTLGKTLRQEGWNVQLHDEHFAEHTPDEEWLLKVGEKRWIVLTKDKAIRSRDVERKAVLAAKVGVFTLPNGTMTGAEMLEVFRNNRLKIGRYLKKHAPPFIAVVFKDAGIHTCNLE